MSDETAETPEATKHEDTVATHVLSILSGLMGVLFLLVYLLILAASTMVKNAPTTGLGAENANYILAIGVGLVVLGLGLQSHNIADFFKQQRGLFALNSTILALLGLVLWLLVNYVAARQNIWRWDLTSESQFTLSEESTKLLNQVEDDVRLVVILPRGDARTDELQILLDQYQTASPRVSIKRHFPEELSREESEALQEDLDVTFYADLIGVAVQYGRATEDDFVVLRSRHLRAHDLWQQEYSGGAVRMVNLGEQKISSAILDVTSGKAPHVYFLEGHEETSFADFSAKEGLGALGKILRSKNYSLSALNLIQEKTTAVPEDADVVVIAGPRRTLGDSELQALENYLNRGGDMLILLEGTLERRVPGQPRQYVQTGLESLLRRRYGVEPVNESLVFVEQHPATGQTILTTTVPCPDFGGDPDVEGDEHGEGVGKTHVIVQDLARQKGAVLVSGARHLEVTPGVSKTAKVQEILKTLPEHTERLLKVRDPREFDQDELSSAGIATLAVAIDDPRGQGEEAAKDPTRLVVIGDVDVASNQFMATSEVHNLELVQNSIAWLTQAEDRIVGKATRPKSYRLDMQIGQVYFFMLLGLFGLPSIPIGLGVFVWLMRRK